MGIPVLGDTLIVSTLWTPLAIMIALHIVALIITHKAGRKTVGHILGIITSVVGCIPLIGTVMHIVTAVFLMIEVGKNE
ncbi:hypothetical protein LIP24_10470 [Collinsella aerofaciens]|uniref:hypothetical protein n=1 Tax=Collinsella aerofaciens TaxID=74426 RepID=UPI001D026C05|nr:hypothetical protein [Collinsella aerofaciens]MCB5367057.1 hypothetical protein [Collinsella aerofaciens]